jgi:hypothetical protein
LAKMPAPRDRRRECRRHVRERRCRSNHPW